MRKRPPTLNPKAIECQTAYPQSDRASDSLSHPAATRRGVTYDPRVRLQRSGITAAENRGVGSAQPHGPTQKSGEASGQVFLSLAIV